MQQQLPLDGEHPGPLFGPLALRKESKKKIRSMLYRRWLRKATPKWADKAAIRKVYEEARVLTRATRLLHTVDHIIPLRGETVCGLHVHNNLRAVLHEDNVRKGNSYCEQWELF
jgi:hypothetical protein